MKIRGFSILDFGIQRFSPGRFLEKMENKIFGGAPKTPKMFNIFGVRVEAPENIERVHLAGMEAIVEIYDTLNDQLQLHELNSEAKKTILTTLNKNLYQLYSIGQIAKTNSSCRSEKEKISRCCASERISP